MRPVQDFARSSRESVAKAMLHLKEAVSAEKDIEYAQSGLAIYYKKKGFLSSKTYRISVEAVEDKSGKLFTSDGKNVAGVTVQSTDSSEMRCLMTFDMLFPYLEKIGSPPLHLFMATVWTRQKEKEDNIDLSEYNVGDYSDY